MTPQTIGRYRVVRRLGSGGFAAVWLAEDPWLDTRVAIKVLADIHSSDPDLRSRFVQEARLLRRIRSPHVVTVYDVGETDAGQPFFVMEEAVRGTLAARLQATRARGTRPRHHARHGGPAGRLQQPVRAEHRVQTRSWRQPAGAPGRRAHRLTGLQAHDYLSDL
jgi:hypothetical protein